MSIFKTSLCQERRHNMSTPVKAIRAKCLDCSSNHPSEVRMCLLPECPLFPYRFGKNPNRKGIGGNKGQSLMAYRLKNSLILQ
jgi:hypothetical protein